jgi:hypothetical protein
VTGNPNDPEYDRVIVLSANLERITREQAIRVLDWIAAKEFL